MFNETKTFLLVLVGLFLFVNTSKGATSLEHTGDCDILTLEAPIVNCIDSDTVSVVFFWEAVQGADDYLVTVSTGQSFTLNGTMVTVTGLSPGELVTIEVQAISNQGMTSEVVESSCSALLCRTADILISPPPTICFPDNSGLITNLEVLVVSDIGGVGLWSGPGIVNSTQGTFDANLVGPGDYTVFYTFVSAACTNLDSTIVHVREQGVAAFDYQDSICVLDDNLIYFTGVAPEGAQLNWNVGTGTISSDTTAEGAYVAHWDTPGTNILELEVDNDGCASSVASAFIQVDMPLDSPLVDCDPTFSSIEYFWHPIENATFFVTNVVNGPLGLQTSDTSYLLQNLAPGQQIGIELVVSSENKCPGDFILPICYTVYCPEVVDVVVPIGPFCFNELETPDTIQLEQTLPDSIDFAQGVWSGNGIIDSIQGILVVDQSMEGINEVYIHYEDEVCGFTDTLVFEVITNLTADMALQDSVCIIDTLNVTFSGTAPPDAVYDWDFDGGVPLSGTGAGPYQVLWSAPGQKDISLKVTYAGCTSDSITQTITVVPELFPPGISCETTPSEVLFSWNTIDGAVDYPVTVLQGGSGTMLSDTSMLFDGLMPLDTVQIQVEAISATACSDTLSTLLCVAVNCPDVSVVATPVAPVCYEEGLTLTLEAMVSGAVGNDGILFWEGNEVSDSENGILDIPQNAAGTTISAYAVYQEASCQYRDTLEIEILETPAASFTMPDTICITDNATITFSGSVDTNATYSWIWDFDGGLPVSGMDDGPYEIKWNDGGLHTVRLSIQGDCNSNVFTQDIFVAEPLPPLVADCTSTVDSIIISWPSVPNAIGYHIEVLEGLPFTMTSDTSIVLENLMPEQEVNFSFFPLIDEACGYIPYEFTCLTTPCPARYIEIQEMEDYCFGGGLDTLQPNIDSNIDLTMGVGVWSGLNVLDPATGLLEVNEASTLHENQLFFTYTEGFCEYRDTLTYVVTPIPVAAFTEIDSICSQDNATFTFTGSSGSDATYDWIFSGGTVVSGDGVGPFEVEWGTAGTYDLSLVVTENNCTSEPFLSTIYVDVPLPEMSVDCIAGLDSVWVSWSGYPSIDNYVITEVDGTPYVFSSDTSIVFSGLAEGQTIDVTITPDITSQCDIPVGTASCTTISCGDAMFDWSVEPVCQGDNAEIVFHSNTTWMFDVSFTDSNGESYTAEDVSDGLSMSLPLLTTTSFSLVEINNKTIPLCQLNPPSDITAIVNEVEEVGTAQEDLSICEGTEMTFSLSGNVSGFVPGGTWQETSASPSGAFDANTGELSIASVPAGHYTFLYRIDSEAPCPPGEVTVGVQVNPLPVVDAGADVQLGCSRLVATLGGEQTSQGGQFQYLWTAANGTSIDNPNELFIEVEEADTYTLLVENTMTGCQSSDEVTVTSDVNFPILFLGMEPVSCYGEEDGYVKVDSVVGGNAPYLYSFEHGDFGQQEVFGPLAKGTYEVTVRDDNGCESTEHILLLGAEAWELTLSTNLPLGESVIQLGEKLTLTAQVGLPVERIDSILWIPDTLTFLDAFMVSTYPQITSTYKVMVTDDNGCTQEDFVTIYVDKKHDVYIPTAFSPNGDGVNDVFMVHAGHKVKQVKEFAIFNRWGEMLFHQKNFQPNDINYGWDGTLDGRPMNANVFIYSAEVELINGDIVRLSGDVVLLR